MGPLTELRTLESFYLPKGFDVGEYLKARLFQINRQQWNKALPGTLIGQAEMIDVFPLIFLTLNLTPDGQLVPHGMSVYRTAGGAWTLKPDLDSGGDRLSVLFDPINGTKNVSYLSVLYGDPHQSDGTGVLAIANGNNYMRASSLLVNAGAGGDVASFAIVAAGAAGIKWVTYEMSHSIPSIAGSIATSGGGVLTLSDGCGFIGSAERGLAPSNKARQQQR